MGLLLGILVLWGSTLGVVAVDKSMRAKLAPGDAPTFASEPSWGLVAVVTIFLNLAALPYYFYATRRSVGWMFVGIGGFVACLLLMIVVQIGCAIVLR